MIALLVEVIVANLPLDPDRCNYGAKNDCWRRVQHVERGLGQVQNREQALTLPFLHHEVCNQQSKGDYISGASRLVKAIHT